MKVRILLLPLAFLWVLVLADQPVMPKDARFYREELLKTRHGMELHGYTSIATLEKRLSVWGHILKHSWGRRVGHHRGLNRRVDFFESRGVRLDNGYKLAGYTDIPDMQVNEDGFTSSFDQEDPSCCMFPDKSFIAVWQDERNGDLDIFGQKYSYEGVAQGVNFEAGEEDFPKDQYLPRVSLLGDTSFVVVWVDEESFVIYGKIFSEDLSVLTGAFQISDSPLDFSTWAPAVSSGPKDEFVVVWEDTRSGSNVYGRRFDLGGSPLGSSFKVNDEEVGGLSLAPDVSIDTSGSFVVIWEDFRDSDGDIYAQRFTPGGTKLGDNVLVNVDSLNEDQYAPSVDIGPDGRFVAAWVDTRREDPFVFARSIWFDDPASDTILFSAGVGAGSWVQEGPRVVSDTLGRFAVSWVEYSSFDRATYTQRFNGAGQAMGDAILITGLHSTAERHSLTLSANPGGSLIVVWMDKETGNYDIYARRIPAYGVPQDSVLTLNDDLWGATQSRPRVATIKDGGFVVVWEDMRRGASDVFVKRFDQEATALGSDQMVNDSTSRVYRGNPDVAGDSVGNFVVVWEDTRGSSLEVYAQLFDHSGVPNGANLKVNCAATVINSTPRCAMSPEGGLAVVWSSANGSATDIYGRLFSPTGLPVDTCFKVNDDETAVNHLSPAISMDSTGRFVVAWQDRREGQDRIYLQRFAPDGTRIGANFPVYTDRIDPLQYDPDLDLNQQGEFAVAWTEPYAYSTMIYAQRYDSSGNPVDTNLMVVDGPSVLPESPLVKLTNGGSLIVAWTDYAEEGSDIYYRVFSGNQPQGSSGLINTEAQSVLQDFPHIDIWSNHIFSVWRDNRVPGLGFSIFFNRREFTETDVDEEQEKEILPVGFSLHRNYPNPFNPNTMIRYSISSKMTDGSPVRATLEVYNVLGQRVRTLVDEEKRFGEYQVIWDGRGDGGEELPSGVYFCRITVKNQSASRKLILLK